MLTNFAICPVAVLPVRHFAAGVPLYNANPLNWRTTFALQLKYMTQHTLTLDISSYLHSEVLICNFLHFSNLLQSALKFNSYKNASAFGRITCRGFNPAPHWATSIPQTL